MKYHESLSVLGLTPDQAKIYEALLSATALPVRLISQKAGVGRELAYVVLGQLERLDLAERNQGGKIALFRARHPRNIKKILEKKREAVLLAEQAYQGMITSLVGEYNSAHDKPFIRLYEGIEGLQKTYDHILRHAKTVRVMRSLHDYENDALRSMVTEQLAKQAAKGIRSYVLTPKLPHMQPEKLIHNPKRNITRKIIAKEKFSLPSQIMIYNNTVSITSMKNEIVTTVIEHEDIAKTFLMLFAYVWDAE